MKPAWWCVKCCGNVDITAFDNECPANSGGAHVRIGSIRIENVAQDLPSNRRSSAKKAKRGSSH